MHNGSRVVALYACLPPTLVPDDQQLPALERWAQALGDGAEWYQDRLDDEKAVRTARTRLLDDVRAQRILKIVIWRLDRLGIPMTEFPAFCMLLRRHGTGLVSVCEGFDLDQGETGKILEAMATIVRADRALRIERIKLGQAQARSRGKKWGGSARGRVVRCTPEKREQILRLYKQGRTVLQIARRVHLSRPTVYHVLRRAGLRRRRRRRHAG